MNVDLTLYVTQEEYNSLAGPDWPSYEDYINYVPAKLPEIQEEINGYTTMFLKDGIKFPIRTKTACQSKWAWSTIYLNNLATASCHRVTPIPLDINNFDNFHNLPKKLNDRQLMLNGEWPKGGCEYCMDIELAGGFSDRQHNLEIRGLTPPEVEKDLTATEVSPRIVEIFAQNTCNLSCTYCNSNLSSKIEQENNKFGHFEKDGVIIPVTSIPSATDEVFEKFINWLNRNITTLVRLHLLGGETFIQHNLMNAVLDIIERNPNSRLELCIFSNLNVPDRIWDQYITRIKDLQQRGHIRVFDLTASIDCWGAESEYARYGLNLAKFEERMAWAAAEDESWLRLNINQTVTALTIHTMPELIEKINCYSQYRHIGHYFQYYTGPQMFQHPKIFPYNFWAKDFERINKVMLQKDKLDEDAILRMSGMQKFLQTFTEYQWTEIHKLQILLDEYDRRRKTNWREIFPYLDVHPSK